jgi:hypothetical protein
MVRYPCTEHEERLRALENGHARIVTNLAWIKWLLIAVVLSYISLAGFALQRLIAG